MPLRRRQRKKTKTPKAKTKPKPKPKPKHGGTAKQGRSSSARRPAPKSRKTPPGAAGKRVGEQFEAFVALQARLRAPGGCPWDREQTHESIKTCLVEETYEVLDALDSGDPKAVTEELGDVLLQVLFHADMAREAGQFDISDVIAGIHDKMVRRHPHVFGNVKADTSDQVLKNWAKLKATEQQTIDASRAPSILDKAPRSFPALLEAYQLTRRASQVGFDWERIEDIFAKLQEEVSELRATLSEADRDHREEEVGDVLFVAVNIARFLGIDPEVALKRSNLKFRSRFMDMEAKSAADGKALGQLSKQELEVLWEAAKARLRQAKPMARVTSSST